VAKPLGWEYERAAAEPSFRNRKLIFHIAEITDNALVNLATGALRT
jgi:hypothetical protein